MDAASIAPSVPVAEAFRRARVAQPLWAAEPVAARLAAIRPLRRAFARSPDRFASTVALPQRTTAETIASELMPLADACAFLEREARRILAPRRLGRRFRPYWLGGVSAEVRREPLGVVLVIGPSNYPLFLPGTQAIQALVAGNAVLVKPGAGGTRAMRALADTLVAAGLAPELFHVLPESVDAARAAVAAGPDKVVLTGSAETGAAVLADLAPRLVPAVMELSGCDAAFVRRDADLDRAVRALIFGLRLNGSATCIAPRRVFVDTALAADLERRLAAAAATVPARDVSPQTAARVSSLIGDAIRDGARLAAGSAGPATAMRPCIVAGARPPMALLRADLFAPVLCLVEVTGDESALAAAADCPYALGASIFGQERGALALASRVRAGSVSVNDVIVPSSDPRLPFGGRGRSGFGVTRGAEGLLEMTAVKCVSVRHGRFVPHLGGPRDEELPLFRAYLHAAHGSRALARLPAWWALLRAMADWLREGGGRAKQ